MRLKSFMVGYHLSRRLLVVGVITLCFTLSFETLHIAQMYSAHAQVSDRPLSMSGELGGGWIGSAEGGSAGGYGALAASYELTPSLVMGARYQLDLSDSSDNLQIAQRALGEARIQLNIIDLIPWLSLLAGAHLSDLEWRASWGVGIGVESLRSPGDAFEVAVRYFNDGGESVWLIGLGWRWHPLLDDPFDE